MRGRDIKRYTYKNADLWLIASHNGNKAKGVPPVNINEYPAIKKHLDAYIDKLEKRADKGDTPYNLRNCVYMDDFSKQKIMYNDINQRLSFCLVPEGWFCNNTVYFIANTPHYKYLLAFLNSNLLDWYYKTLSVQLGKKAVRMFSIYVENIPIPPMEQSPVSQIEILIDSILHSNSDEEINILSSEIDNIVSKAYDLTNEEKGYINSVYLN